MKQPKPSASAQKTTLLFSLAAFLLVLALAAAIQAGQEEPREISAEKACPVCGMYPHRYPDWHAQVIFTDGSMEAFDGGKCMFRFLLNMEKFAPGRTAGQIAAIKVRDFAGAAWIDGTTAHYVVGSREMGPMGRELIPFATRAAAEEFRKTKGGSVKVYGEIDMETVAPLMGHGGGGHHGH